VSIEDSTPERRLLKTTDPMERIIERALIDAGINYVAERDGAVDVNLDFYLPDVGVYIEVSASTANAPGCSSRGLQT
jgi:hypothetical protein